MIQCKLEDWNWPTTGIAGVSVYRYNIRPTANDMTFDPEEINENTNTYGYGNVIVVQIRDTISVPENARDDTIRLTVTFYYNIKYMGDVIRTDDITVTATINVVSKGICLGTIVITVIPIVAVLFIKIIKRRR